MSPAISAQPNKSTGPRTDEGKKRSALNAMRHGLTGRTVVMPHEDMEAYKAFCNELFGDLAPETAIERVYAQAFCDSQWRLNRARSIEDSMIALGHCEAAGEIQTEHPQVHAALTAARVFRDDSKSFVNLSLYEQRLQRTLEKSLRQLQTLQAERRAAAAQAPQTLAAVNAEPLPNPNKTEEKSSSVTQPPPSRQFVFSTAEIEPAAVRPFGLVTAQNIPGHDAGRESPRESPAFAPAA
jgi:hypothetical protein